MEYFTGNQLFTQSVKSVKSRISPNRPRLALCLPRICLLLCLVAGVNSHAFAAWSGNGSAVKQVGSTYYVVYQDSYETLNTIETGPSISLSGPGATLTYEAKGSNSVTGAGTNYFYYSYSTDNGNNWTDKSQSLTTSYASYSASLSSSVNAIRFLTKTGSTYTKNVQNIRVTMAQYVEAPSKTSIAFGTKEPYSVSETQTFTVAWCNVPAMTYSLSGTNAEDVSVSVANNAEAGKYNTATFTVKYNHTVPGNLNATLTIEDTYGSYSKTVTLTGSTYKYDQTLEWVDEETILTSMLNGSHQAIVAKGNPSGLIATSYESSDSTIISVDVNGLLVAKAEGEATITAYQAGNDLYKAATPISKTFTVLPKATPLFLESGFIEGENELKVDDVVTLALTNVSDGLEGDFTATASTNDVIGIVREGNTLSFTALHEGSTSVTVAQAENANIYGASKIYTFNVTRYTPEFTLSATELELEQTATLTLSHVDGQSISFVPEGIVSYDANSGLITAAKVGTTTLTISQPQTNSIEAKEAEYTITVSKKTPTLTVKMNDTARTSLSISRGNTATVTFEKVSDADVVVTNVSGAQYTSYVDGVITAAAVGTSVYRATLAETDTYQAASVEFKVTVTANSNHLPITGKSYTIGNGSATDWTHKYEVLSFKGVPDKLSFNFAYIYTVEANIGNPTLCYDNLSSFAQKILGIGGYSDTRKGVGNTHMLYVEESADGNSWTTIWTDDDGSNQDTRSSGEIQLNKATRYLRFHHSCNFSNSYTNISITELKYVETPDPSSIDFGSAVINSGEVSKTSVINWCNVAPLTVTSSNPRFTVNPASFGNYEQYSTQILTISYTHTNEAGTNSGDITISNGVQSQTIHVTATTTKRPQTITWNSDLSSTGFAMNVDEQYPDSIVTVLASATSGERITYTSDAPEIVEVIADTALLAKAIGTAKITAYQAGDAEYQEVSSTVTFQVTDKRKQSITWEQNLYGLLTTSGSVELTATATSGGPVTYTSANTNVVKVDGNVLTVVGEGETTITATQAGYTDDDGVEWLAVSQDNYVIVRNPASQCNQMALSQGSLTLNSSKKQQEYNLVGMPETLTFTAKHGTKSSSTWGSASYSALIVEQYLYKDGIFEWYEVYNNVVGTSDTQSGSIAIDESATKLRFRTLETGTDHTISNIRVTRKKLMRADITSVDEEAETNTAWQQKITVTHSNIDLMTLSTQNGLLSLSQTTLGSGCGDYGDDAFTVSFTPTEKNKEYNDVIIITDGKATPSSIEIPVRLTTKGLNQSINDFELPATAQTTDDIFVSTTASSGLEVAFLSSDSTIAYVEDGRLVILQGGTVTITATQDGNEKYDAATPVEKTIVINKVATEITTAPTAATIVYGQSLSESELTGGEASVEGSFAWENPDTKPVAGTQSYNVVFTPEQSGIYATSTKLVSLRVEKATPVVTTWPTATDITIAQSLNDSELKGGEANVEGEFTWKNGAENRLHQGTYERTVVFTPADANYNSVEGTVSVTVINVLARIEEYPVAVAENAVYGIKLSEVTLQGGSASVAGSFAWANPDSVAQAGTHTYPVLFTPEDLELYAVVKIEVGLTVAKATPEITVEPAATAIRYGQTLENSVLSGEATVAGSFVWAKTDTLPEVGSHVMDVIFLPTDDNNYNSIETEAVVTVEKADAVVSVQPTAISGLSYTGDVHELVNAGETETGTISYRLGEEGAWTSLVPTAVNAGVYAIYYQVSGDANHTDSEVFGPIYAEIGKAEAVVTVPPTASPLTYGQTLEESELAGGETNTTGWFVWSNPNEQPEVGTAEYEVTFTPEDTDNYAPAILYVTVTVNKLSQTIEWTEELTPMVITGTRTFTATATSGLEVVFSSSDEQIAYFEGNVLHAVAPGVVTITATQEGDEHYAAAEPVARQIEVLDIEPVEPAITIKPEAAPIVYGQPLGESQLQGGEAEVEGTFAWVHPDTVPEIGTHVMDVIFTPEDQIYYLPTVFSIEVTVLAPASTYGYYAAVICEGDSVEYEGVWYNDTTETEVLLSEKNAYGGDSIVRLTVSVQPVYSFTDSLEIHAGMYDIWQGIAIGQLPEGDTTLVKTYQTVNGCDSAYTLHLSVLPMIITYGYDTIYGCAGDRIVYEGKTYRRSTEEDVLVSEKNIYGGDSIVHLVVYIMPVSRVTTYQTIDQGDSVIWQDIDLSAIAAGDTTLTVTYTSVYGCDSIFTLNLTVQAVTPQTAIDQVDGGEADGECTKFIRDGQMYIRKNGRLYNLQGIKVKDEE